MIISDLSHFEEVVAEAPNIVGGGGNSTSSLSNFNKKISAFRAKVQKKKDQFRARIQDSKSEVLSVTAKQDGASATATIASDTTAQGKLEVSTSTSSAKA